MSYEIRERRVREAHAHIFSVPAEDYAAREVAWQTLLSIFAGALTPVSEDEKQGMQRVLAILERKIAEGGAICAPDDPMHVEHHNRFYRGRWSAFQECALMLQAALDDARGAAP